MEVRYNKQIKDGYIIAIGKGAGGEEITKEEYDTLLELIKSKPTAAEGYDYRLRIDLTWEEYEKPIVEAEHSAQDDTDAMLVDHEYRITLLELGV